MAIPLNLGIQLAAMVAAEVAYDNGLFLRPKIKDEPIPIENRVSSEEAVKLISRKYEVDLARLNLAAPGRKPEQALRDMIEKSGVTVAPKDLFLNERTGETTIRGTRTQFVLIEPIVSSMLKKPLRIALETSSQISVEIEMQIAAFSGPASFHLHAKTNFLESNMFTGLMTRSNFTSTRATLEAMPGVDFLSTPPVVTVSGRQARLAIEQASYLSPQTPPHAPRPGGPASDPTPLGNSRPSN